MSEVFSYNNYAHEPDKVWFSIQRTGIVGPTGRIMKTRHTWTVNGSVNSSRDASPAAARAQVNDKVLALENSLVDGGDIVFSLGSSMRLLNSDCLEGVHCRSFSWLPGYDGVRGSGAEGILRRTYRIVFYGDVLATTDTDIIQWQESIRTIGTGLANVVPAGSLAGPVQAQQIQAFTPYYMLQSGFAVGLTDWPSPPTPAYQGIPGVYYLPNGVSSGPDSPRRYGVNGNTEFPVRWSYRCWSSLLLTGYNPSSF